MTGLDSTDRIVYNTTTGALYYDADGSNPGAEFSRRVASEVMNATIVNLPAGLDISDYYLQNGYDETRRLLGVASDL